MKCFYFLLIIILVSLDGLKAQISYNNTDMPIPGKIIIVSQSAATTGINPTLTGLNYTWNFGNLIPASQSVDTFVSVSSLALIYQAVFNNPILYPNNKATVVGNGSSFNLPVGTLNISNFRDFFKNSTANYSLVGYGGDMNGIAVPVPYASNDILYKFPVGVSSLPDSSFATYSIPITGIGYFGQNKKRVNRVDGWGNITTPYGTFSAIRLKSVVNQKDTIYLDTLGFALPSIISNFIEYKWVAKGIPVPLLQITTTFTGAITEVSYVDSLRPWLGIENPTINQFSINIYPNPVSSSFIISHNGKKEHKGQYRISDIQGRIIAQGICKDNETRVDISTLSDGTYFISILIQNHIMAKKIVKQ